MNLGSTFWFTLKSNISAKSNAEILKAQANTGKQDYENISVLLVDDNDINRLVTSRMLLKLGCNVDQAVNGLEAVQISEKQVYSIILMDCSMPVMDGYEASKELRNRGGLSAGTPIVAFTASVTAVDQSKCRDAGMNDFIPKPVKIGELERVLARWVLSQASAQRG